ncbi:hypothetical protein CEUSTIGMA_g11667.t1 [Chlamydomonas eustigma]|uniref:Coiled-coil domain-containing protein 61 n=1 Tax=Chlamydomonas eustigma TaxID=1157962 RepID=A0A250XMC6_9CHLO|nr:hypothetical protein CEUSTIGMA_g11667.t1 [Chlamydomonas eustigma]|eukprot:GAX84244.1 hypothetical protein CEUSTIGMA_g11667.t1 [Chlamydomonas eustigma]
MSLHDFSETVEISFHDVAYALTTSVVNGDTLSIDVEQLSDASRWRGDFTSRYIEDITTKTGNFKKFPVFCKMLLSAFKQASDSVFVDLLTYQDLEALKTRQQQQHAGGHKSEQARPSLPPSNKRYLILTYAAEFDRVHYPLPLLYDDNPDPTHLRQVITRLRAELDASRKDQQDGSLLASRGITNGSNGSEGDSRRLREENAALRQQLRQMDKAVRSDLPENERISTEAREMARELKAVRKERDVLIERCEVAEAELERERGLHRRELRRKAKEAVEVHEELLKSKEAIRDLKLQIRRLEDSLAAASVTGGSSRATGRSGLAANSAERARAVYGTSSRPTSSSRPSRGGGSTYQPYGSGSHQRSGVGRETSSRERGSSYTSDRNSRPSSRPSSAPIGSGEKPFRGGRFDPTEWVRQRQSGYSSAGSSARSSPYTSRANSRPTSAEGAGRPSSGYERAGSRPSSVERGRPSNSSVDSGRRRTPTTSDPLAPPPAGGSSSRQQSSRRQQGSPSSAHSNPPAARGGWANPTSTDRLYRGLPTSTGLVTAGSAGAPPKMLYVMSGGVKSGGSSRAGSVERDERSRSGVRERELTTSPGGGGRGRGSYHDDYNRQPSASSPSARAAGASGRPSADSGNAPSWSKFPAAAGASGRGAAGADSPRATSPGRALQEVKRKLSEFVGNRRASTDSSSTLIGGGGGGGGGGATASSYHYDNADNEGAAGHHAATGLISSGGGRSSAAVAASSVNSLADDVVSTASRPVGDMYDETSIEIADIDSRLQSLQSFLKLAKSAAAASAKS